jgi:hypothetical protein
MPICRSKVRSKPNRVFRITNQEPLFTPNILSDIKRYKSYKNKLKSKGRDININIKRLAFNIKKNEVISVYIN